jgi:hypothetical protein
MSDTWRGSAPGRAILATIVAPWPGSPVSTSTALGPWRTR